MNEIEVKVVLTVRIVGTFPEVSKKIEEVMEFDFLKPFDAVRRHNGRVTESFNGLNVINLGMELGRPDGTFDKADIDPHKQISIPPCEEER